MNKRIIGYAVIAVAVLVSLTLNQGEDQQGGKHASGADRSYWDYTLPDLSGMPGGGGDCPAFFDRDPGTVAAPAPPPVSAFDRAVLRACGPLGGRVSEAEFEALMSDHVDTVAAVLPTDWRALPAAERLARLKQVWLTHEGFDHVFCGEWERGSIGGLHFRARFLQLQAEASACLMPSDKQEIEPGQVYSIGVTSADGRHRHEIKGYALNQDALDLLRIGTRTQAQCCQAGSSGWEPYRRWQSKVLRVESAEGGQPISNRVICRADDPKRAASIGLITLYSDATPDRRSPVCDVR